MPRPIICNACGSRSFPAPGEGAADGSTCQRPPNRPELLDDLPVSGNGRALFEPPSLSQPCLLEAIGSAGWTPAPLRGAPLWLVVPGWFRMTSAKWLATIDSVAEPFADYR